ncbi:MAG: DUF2802 domain-containing protein [Gammaproteobacteria bacterium]|nr:DUF2802 domain-containing protein [Gammaproteobacteria bacterium]MDH5730195.1 DUF2802 domain-containing protein [Gammaproteobacteria bacterium]
MDTGAILVVALTLFAFTGINGLIVFWLIARNRRFEKKITRQYEQIRDDNKILFDAEARMGEKLHRMEKQLRFLNDRQDQFSLKEPSEQTYQYALRLMREGKNDKTIIEESGLGQGELDLLKRMQKVKKTQTLQTVVD